VFGVRRLLGRFVFGDFGAPRLLGGFVFCDFGVRPLGVGGWWWEVVQVVCIVGGWWDTEITENEEAEKPPNTEITGDESAETTPNTKITEDLAAKKLNQVRSCCLLHDLDLAASIGKPHHCLVEEVVAHNPFEPNLIVIYKNNINSLSNVVSPDTKPQRPFTYKVQHTYTHHHIL